MSPDPSVDDGRSLVGNEPLAEDEDDRSRMTFLEHLDELRRRIVYSLYAVIASCIVMFVFVNDMYAYMTNYFAKYGGRLVYTEPMGGFMFSLKIAVLAGLILASPFVFSQLWLFVAPGLYAREKKVVIPFVFISSALFFSGAGFAHTIGYPYMWQFFASFQTDQISFLPDISKAFGFYTKVVLTMGLVFQMPVLVFFLARFGVLTARFMIAKFKYAVLIIIVIAAVITPSGDAVTLTVFAAPMMVLYCISIGVAWIVGKKRAARLAAEDVD